MDLYDPLSRFHAMVTNKAHFRCRTGLQVVSTDRSLLLFGQKNIILMKDQLITIPAAAVAVVAFIIHTQRLKRIHISENP